MNAMARTTMTITVVAVSTVLAFVSTPVFAGQDATEPAQHEHGTAPATPEAKAPPPESSDAQAHAHGGSAPAQGRDPNAYADGFEYTGMPGMEQADRIAFGTLLGDEIELLSGNEGSGTAWTGQAAYGGDLDKLWLRTQGLGIKGEPIDPTTGVEALWWRARSPFWGTLLGARQDFGPGAHTWLAAGVEGIAPYWFHLQATGYVGDDGRLSGRLRASYDMLFTNRLILTPQLESNVYSRAEPDRELGAGVGNLELGLRLRYEMRRKFAPYIGYVWERSFAGTADARRAQADPVTEFRFVAGVRLWR
ncbi:MAG: copper resistance protein B [Acidobacteria bacterium]|nr:copper resistance protein B [Acidobacteriota bacterium]